MTEAGSERRKVLANLGLAAMGYGILRSGVADAKGSPAASTHGAGSDVAIMQGALELEHEGIAAYRLAGQSGLLTPGTLATARLFMGHHEQHRESLASLITKAGGKPQQPKQDTAYITELNLGALKSEADVIALAIQLEQGAANAYVGQVAALRDRKLAHLFTQLASDESVHWTALTVAVGRPIPAHAYLFG
jgi:hypothetical protein